MVIPYWIIKSTDTHLENVLFNLFFLEDNYSHVPQCCRYIVCIFGIYYFVCTCWIRLQNVKSFEQVLEFYSYVIC